MMKRHFRAKWNLDKMPNNSEGKTKIGKLIYFRLLNGDTMFMHTVLELIFKYTLHACTRAHLHMYANEHHHTYDCLSSPLVKVPA